MHPDVEDYYWIMAARRRLIAIDGAGTGLCTFFVLQREEEVATFYDRKCWSTPPDHAEGSIIYFDKLVCTHFTKALWQAITQRVTEVIPQWERFVWYRPGQDADRRYTWNRPKEGRWRRPTP